MSKFNAKQIVILAVVMIYFYQEFFPLHEEFKEKHIPENAPLVIFSSTPFFVTGISGSSATIGFLPLK